jgi:hypothetical protein
VNLIYVVIVLARTIYVLDLHCIGWTVYVICNALMFVILFCTYTLIYFLLFYQLWSANQVLTIYVAVLQISIVEGRNGKRDGRYGCYLGSTTRQIKVFMSKTGCHICSALIV